MTFRAMTLAACAAALVTSSALAQGTAVRRGENVQTAPAQGTVRPAAPGQAVGNPAAPGQGTAGRMAVSDSLFAAAAASGGLAELSLSELGAQRATDADLKKFSQKMIDEHSRMNNELMTTASQKGIALPRTPDVRAQFCAQSLQGLTGAEFDRCYAKAQLVAHMDALATFQAEADRGQDPQLKALAARAVPHIQGHLKEIKPIASRFEKEEPGTSDRHDDHHDRDNASKTK